MRRVEGKLSALNWKLVLFAGIFQILTLIFDQVVIQYEEKNREMTFNLLTESEQRSAYLSMNRRVHNFVLAFENIIFFTVSSNFSNDKKKYLYSSYLSDQVRIIEDIFRDGSIKKAFLNLMTSNSGLFCSCAHQSQTAMLAAASKEAMPLS